jgi:septum formation topological specificity factor MinE
MEIVLEVIQKYQDEDPEMVELLNKLYFNQ